MSASAKPLEHNTMQCSSSRHLFRWGRKRAEPPNYRNMFLCVEIKSKLSRCMHCIIFVVCLCGGCSSELKPWLVYSQARARLCCWKPEREEGRRVEGGRLFPAAPPPPPHAALCMRQEPIGSEDMQLNMATPTY